jgi:hypothetical protein
MANPNLQLLVDAAKLLKPILGELVFVGGCTTALLITDKGAADVRPTYDVDAIVEITSYVEYAGFSEKLKALGFREDAREGAPFCRWCQKTTTLDVMPVDGSILGFKNRWYKPAMATAEERELEPGLKILIVNPVYFCASKLEAFGDRGERFHTLLFGINRLRSDELLHCWEKSPRREHLCNYCATRSSTVYPADGRPSPPSTTESLTDLASEG